MTHNFSSSFKTKTPNKMKGGWQTVKNAKTRVKKVKIEIPPIDYLSMIKVEEYLAHIFCKSKSGLSVTALVKGCNTMRLGDKTYDLAEDTRPEEYTHQDIGDVLYDDERKFILSQYLESTGSKPNLWQLRMVKVVESEDRKSVV